MIVSIGEVVWDIFPDKQVLGGAPVNVAYHLGRLGQEVRVVTRVGDDPLGKETLTRLAALGLSLGGVQKDGNLSTGRVNVSIDQRNEPHFDIVAPAAWDNLDAQEALRFVGEQPFSLVFGTLAQRETRSREAVHALREKAATRFYDVNLRPPFTTRELVLDSLAHAEVVKLNDAELTAVAAWLGIGSDDQKNVAKTLCSRYDLAAVAVTRGQRGAWLVAEGSVYADPGEAVMVADTVGAGDAFFAALIEGYLNKRPWRDILRRANRRGAYVASRHGATPPMPENL